jgi:anti-sigma B factor antagonist
VNLVVSTRPGAGCTVVEVHGDLDMDTHPQLRDHLQPLVGAGQVVVDLSGVGFMDSSALGTLVVVFKAVRAAGGRLCVAGVQQSVRTVLGITSVDQVIDVYDSVQAAEASMPPGGGVAAEQASIG